MSREQEISRGSLSGLGKALKKSVFAVLLFAMVVLPSMPVMADMTNEDIQERIDNAEKGSTIDIDIGWQHVWVDEPICIDKPLTVNLSAPDLNVSGHFHSPIKEEDGCCAFDITGNNVTLNLTNITFTTHNPDEGGAINITGNNVTINGGEFWWCESYDEGGAIYINGDHATIKNAYFEECHTNDGEDGGVIYVADTHVTIEDCTFVECYSEGNGGAIALHSGINDYLKIKNCEFVDCYLAKEKSKGKWVYGAGDTTIENCTGPYDEDRYNDCEFSGEPGRKSKNVAASAAQNDTQNDASKVDAAVIEDIQEADAQNEGAVEADAQSEEEAEEAAVEEEVVEEEVVEEASNEDDEVEVNASGEEAAEEAQSEESVGEESYDTGSVLSGGQAGIVIAVVVIAIAVIAALVVAKKKRESEK